MADINSQNFPYKVKLRTDASSWLKRAQLYDWCMDTFGQSDSWEYGADTFRFRHEKDAILFMLKWQ